MRRASIVLCATLLACGLAVRRPVCGPSHRYQLSGFSVIGPQGRGWWVTGGREVTNDWLLVPQDRDLYSPSRANFLMFSQVWYLPKEHSTTGAFALREEFTMPAGGLEALEARIARRLERDLPRARFNRYDVKLAVTDPGGRACVQLTVDLEFKPVGGREAAPHVHRGVRYWCPASTAEGSPVVRIGLFQYHRADDPPPRDYLPDVQAMLRSLEFTPPDTP